MREIVWALVGWLLGIGAARRARNDIASAHLRQTAYFYGALNQSPAFVPAVAFINGAVAYGIADGLDGEVATFAFIVFATALVQLMFVDIDTHLLPKRTSRGASVLGLVLLGFASLVQWDPARWWWGILGSFLMWFVLRILKVLSRGELGGGDVTLGILIGLHLGWLAIGNVLIALLVSFLIGGVAGLVTLAVRRNKRHFMAFGPSLVAGALLTVVFEEQLRGWILG